MGFNKLSVLIVETNDSLRSQLFDYFSKQGCHPVHMASSFAEARKLIYKKPQLDLILFDIEITHASGQIEDGMDFMDEIKRSKVLPLRTAFVVLTGESRYPKIYEALKQGVDAYLLKPISMGNLGAKLTEIISRRQSVAPIYAEIELGHIDTAMSIAKDMYMSQKNQTAGKIVYELLMMEDKLEDARAFLTSANQDYQVWACLEIAKLDIKLGNVAQGVSRLKKLNQAVPLQPEILEILYYGLWEIGDQEGAISCMEEAVRIHPFNAARVQILSLVYFKLGSEKSHDLMLKAFNMTKSSRLLNFSLLVSLYLSALKHGFRSIESVVKYVGQGLEGEEVSLRVSLISSILKCLKLVITNHAEEGQIINLLEKIKNSIFDKRLDWDTAFSCLQVLNRCDIFQKQALSSEIVTCIVQRFGSNAGYLNSIKLELTKNIELTKIALNAHQEINAKIQSIAGSITTIGFEQTIEELYKIAETHVNARALNLALGMLNKQEIGLTPEAIERLKNLLLSLKNTAYFSGNNLFTSNRWFMSGRY